MSKQQQSPNETKTEVQSEIHACVDVMVPLELRDESRELAAKENPANDNKSTDPKMNERAFVLAKKIWKPGRTLRVRFMGGTPQVQEKVRKYANEWSKHIGIKFNFGDYADAEIRIAFVKDGSWSYIGTDALAISKAQPTMNYGWFDKPLSEDEYSRVIIHEFGHALGMPHEHSHPENGIPWNKEAVYRYYEGPPNNWSRAQVDNNLFAKYDKSITKASKFDRESIMLYPIPKEFVNDQKFAVGMNTKLSETDKKFMAKVYPKS